MSKQVDPIGAREHTQNVSSTTNVGFWRRVWNSIREIFISSPKSSISSREVSARSAQVASMSAAQPLSASEAETLMENCIKQLDAGALPEEAATACFDVLLNSSTSAKTGTYVANLCRLAGASTDHTAYVDKIANKLRSTLFHNGNFINALTKMERAGKLSTDVRNAVFKFYLSRLNTFSGNPPSNRAEFLRFAIQLVPFLPNPKQGAKEVVNAYLEALMPLLRLDEKRNFLQGVGIPNEFTQLASGLKEVKDATNPLKFEEIVYEISGGVEEAIDEYFTQELGRPAPANGLMPALYAKEVLT
jgi:hypothetical protein